MAILDIVLHPHRALYTKSKPVEAFDDTLHELLDNMAETMYAANGVGLAANQINVLQRITVIDVGTEEEPQLLEIINPEIVERSGSITWEEGCLSFPQVYEKIKRANKVTVQYKDRHGNAQEVSGEELLAVALQHEIDHLDGICFVDRMGPMKRKLALKEFARVQAALKREALEAASKAEEATPEPQ